MATMRKHLLDRNSFPARLWSKARKDSAWDPGNIELGPDHDTWAAIPAIDRQAVLHVCGLFLEGERAVTLNLLPLMHVVASEGRMEEEVYLTSLLSDEAKHVDFFCRFFEEVATDAGLPYERGAGYRRVLDEELTSALAGLYIDPSPVAQVRASATYNIAVEGILAETGQYLLRRMLTERAILPGVTQGLQFLQRDESRHIAYGVYFLSRLIVEHGNCAYKAFLDRMSELKPLIEEATKEFMSWREGRNSFSFDADELMHFSQVRFANRVQRIIRARSETLQQLNSGPLF